MIDTLYILSAGRCGSTLLDLMLGSHPDAVALSELTQLPRDYAYDDRCSCGVLLQQCAFWRTTLGKLGTRLNLDLLRDPFSLQLGFIANPRRQYRPPLTRGYERTWKVRHGLVYLGERTGMPLPAFARRSFDVGITNTLALYDVLREVSGASVVVDASKAYLKGLALYRRRPEQTRLILLSRNGRASFYSRLRDGYGRARSMRAWRNYYRHALPLLEQHVPPEHLIRVKYEDLATHPAEQVGRICDLAGLTYAPQMLDVGSKVHHVTSGNDMRLNQDRRIRLDTAWESGLQPADRRFFEAAAGAINRRLGYE